MGTFWEEEESGHVGKSHGDDDQRQIPTYCGRSSERAMS